MPIVLVRRKKPGMGRDLRGSLLFKDHPLSQNYTIMIFVVTASEKRPEEKTKEERQQKRKLTKKKKRAPVVILPPWGFNTY
jgi:hypothetical protein